MSERLELQLLLEKILGSRNVYFQPPENIKLKYPCIIYAKANEHYRFADNRKYMNRNIYDVTVIDSNPDSKIPKEISELEYCSFNRCFINDGLYHNVYQLIY